MPAEVIVIDIETHPTTDAYQLAIIEREAREARPASNARVAVKAEWDSEGAAETRVAEAIAKTSCDTSLAEVLCAAFVAPGAVSTPGCLQTFSAMGPHSDEPTCLSRLAGSLHELSGPLTVWAGHNIRGFDLQILLNRWRRWGITPPASFPLFRAGRWDGNVYDTMSEFPCKTGFISLSNASRLLGLTAAKSLEWRGEPMTGARVKEAYDAGEYTMLLDYCACDVQAELALYNAMTFGGAWGVKPRPHNAAGVAHEPGPSAPTLYADADKASVGPGAADDCVLFDLFES